LYATTFPDDDLRRLFQHLARTSGVLEAGQASHEHGGVRLSISETFALGELAEAGSLSQQELAARLGLEKSTVSRLAAGMEGRGWLTRERDVDDRRLYRLVLTGEGLDVARRVGTELRVHHAQLLERMSPEERRALAVGVGALVRELDAAHRHGAERP
jgi:DNA-binding MarR family transcriptional regulator